MPRRASDQDDNYVGLIGHISTQNRPVHNILLLESLSFAADDSKVRRHSLFLGTFDGCPLFFRVPFLKLTSFNCLQQRSNL